MKIIESHQHPIQQSAISKNAVTVLTELQKAGYEAYVVGGSVRDLFLEREPKDFDIATDAHPSKIRRLFRNCRLIGRRFRLAHIHFRDEIIEVATFRGAQDSSGFAHDPSEENETIYGTLEEDAWRRDFTVNALYYNHHDQSIIDYTGGFEDLKNGTMRTIGDPHLRFPEDPVRTLRAVRFLTKTGFRLEDNTAAALAAHKHLLKEISPARLFDEIQKLFHHGQAYENFMQLRHYELFGEIFPAAESCLAGNDYEIAHQLMSLTCKNTDARIADGKRITPAFIFSAFLWYPVQERIKELEEHGHSSYKSFELGAEQIIQTQNQTINLAKRYQEGISKVWSLQKPLAKLEEKHAQRFLLNYRFRAAYDFLLLRAESGEDVQNCADWWTAFQEDHPEIVEKAEAIRKERYIHWKKIQEKRRIGRKKKSR